VLPWNLRQLISYFEWNQYLDKSYDVLFMGSSLGGFASEYLAMKTGCKAIMINQFAVCYFLAPAHSL
jgi:predicted esterase YcpF (UPF0227 family)